MAERNVRGGQPARWLTSNLRWLLLVSAAGLLMTGPAPASHTTVVLLVLAGLYIFGLMLHEFVDPGRDSWLGLTLALDFALGLSLYVSASSPLPTPGARSSCASRRARFTSCRPGCRPL